MKKLVFIVMILTLLTFGLAVKATQAQTTVPFGGNLDRPVSTEDADKQEKEDGAKDEPPVPDDPGDDDEEEPPEFMDEPLEGHKFVLVLDRSCSMGSGFSAGYPIYDRNGNALSRANRWQATQSEGSGCVNAMDEEDSFDIITYATQLYICFGSLTVATTNAKSQATGWLYSQRPTG